MTPRSVSFVIPVKNDAARLRRCLETIRRGTPADVDVEVIVADNGSVDDSAAAATESGAHVLLLPGERVGALRNHGALVARGDILAFIDADNEIVAGWIPAAVDALADAAHGAAGAPYHAPSPATWVQRVYDRLRRHPVAQEPVDWLGSGNMAVCRTAFEAVGGFDTTLETCEDIDLCRKLRAQGYLIVSDHRLGNVHHGDPRTLGQVFHGELWRGRDNIRVSLRPPWSGRTLASAAIPVVALTAGAFSILGLVTGTAAGFRVSAVAVSLVLVLVALRAALILRSEWRANWLGAFAVAAAYEAGRALALAGRFGHRRRRSAAAVV